MSKKTDLLDLSKREIDCEEGGVRLISGLNLSDMNAKNGGVLINPDYDGASPVDNETSYNRADLELVGFEYQNLKSLNIDGDYADLKAKMDCISEDGGVHMLSIRPSYDKDAEKPPHSASVTIHYELRIEGQDEPFDSTFIRAMPERFKLHGNQLLPGLERVIENTFVGETTLSIISSKYAFGEFGVPQRRIPGNCEILAVVKLLDFTPQGEAEMLLDLNISERMKLSVSDVLTAVHKEHQIANHFVKTEEWILAKNHYDFCVTILEERRDSIKYECDEIKVLLEKLYLNKAHCFIKLEQWNKALAQCKKALGMNENSLKGHYRLGKVYIKLELYTKAREHLTLAHNLAPRDPIIEQEIVKLDQLLCNNTAIEKAFAKNVFKNVKKIDKVKCADELKFLESEVFKTLEKFAKDDEIKDLTLPAIYFNQEWKVIKQCVNHLHLNIRILSGIGAGTGTQKLLITKKSSK